MWIIIQKQENKRSTTSRSSQKRVVGKKQPGGEWTEESSFIRLVFVSGRLKTYMQNE